MEKGYPFLLKTPTAKEHQVANSDGQGVLCGPTAGVCRPWRVALPKETMVRGFSSSRRNRRTLKTNTDMSAHSELKKVANKHNPWVKRPNTGHLADAALAAAAAEAIEWLTTVPQETIKITAHNGWLYLEGTVNWCSQRTTVEDVTRHLPGVRGVIDSITIDAVPCNK